MRLVAPIRMGGGMAVTEAVFGRSSDAKANGSAFSGRICAVGPDDLDICRRRPAPMSGMKISHMPVSTPPRIGMPPAVPVVEVADHRDAPGIGRPDGEMHAVGALMLDECAPSLSNSR